MIKLTNIIILVLISNIYDYEINASNITFNKTPPIPKSENVTQLKLDSSAVQSVASETNINDTNKDELETSDKTEQNLNNQNEFPSESKSKEYTKEAIEELKQKIQDPANSSDELVNIFNILVEKIISDHMINKAIRNELINIGLRIVTLPGGERIKATVDYLTPRKTAEVAKTTTLYKANVIMPSEYCERIATTCK